MSSEAALTREGPRVGVSIWRSVRRRAELAEWLDEPCSYEDLRDSLRDLGRVGRVIGVHRLILRWLNRFADGSGRPLHILDAGCGGGDMLRCIQQWASQRRISVKLTGIDLNPNVILAAREFTPPQSTIRWVVSDAESFLCDEPVDLIINSLVTHHLDDAKIVRLIGWMERTASRGWLIHDLYRSRAAVAGFRTMAWLARWHRFVRDDGAISIRRAFVPGEWRQYLEQAGVASSAVRIVREWPVRICVMREKKDDFRAMS